MRRDAVYQRIHRIASKHARFELREKEFVITMWTRREILRLSRSVQPNNPIIECQNLLRGSVGNADSGFVFPGRCHGFIDPDRFETDIWQPIVNQTGLKGTRFHDLRHFLASQLIANGETAAYVFGIKWGIPVYTLPSTPTGICFQAEEERPATGTKNRWMQLAENPKGLLAIV